MSVDPIETSEAVPRGSIVERDGQMSRAFRNWLERGNRQQGKVISGIAQLDAAIQVTQGLVTDIEGQLGAYYALSVDVGGNGAFLKLSDNTAFGSAISLSANEITLDADAINFGAQTEFDTATETFITEAGGVRTRYGAPFGASSDLLRWYGPTSVPQGSETRTNGYLTEGTDGIVRYGTAPLNWGATAAEAAASNDIIDAKYRPVVMPERVSVAADFSTEFTTFDAAALTIGTTAAVANEGVVRTFNNSAVAYLSNRSSLPVYTGRTYELVCRSRVVSDGTGNRMVMSFRVFASDGTYLGAFNFQVMDASFTAADGWQTHTLTAPASSVLASFPTAAFIKGYALGNANASTVAVASWQVAYLRLRDATDPIKLATVETGADVTATNTAAAIQNQGSQAIANHQRGLTYSGTPTEGSWWADTSANQLKLYTGGSWQVVADIAPAVSADEKTVSKQNLDLDIDTSGTTWIVGPTFDMTVGTNGFLSCPFASLYAGVGMVLSAGSTFLGNWRITEATQAAPSTKTVVWSGTFTADASPNVTGFVSPTIPILATKSGACRYTLEVQRASGTNNVSNLASFLSLTWTPSG